MIRPRFLPLLGLLAALSAQAAGTQHETRQSQSFDPHSYAQSDVKCPAVDRSDSEIPTTTEININYVEVKPQEYKDTILMVHGWPGMWSTWARQIDHFQNKYHLLVPSLRGFYKSTHPGDVHSGGTYSDFVSDLVCVLDAAGVESAICMGHDWGSQLCFEAARQRPDKFKAVVGLVVPYLPAVGPYIPTAYLAKLAPRLAYQAYFASKTEEATEELDQSVRRTLRAIIRAHHNPPPEEFLKSTDGFLHVVGEEHELEPIVLFSELEEDYLVEGLRIQGFGKTLQFYVDGNRKLSHELATSQGNHTIHTPSLLILPSQDRVANWRDAIKLVHTEKFMTNLVIRDIQTAHWPHLERPEEVNALIDEFLEGLEAQGRGREEL